jgi:CheY-like chemotaxis protein
VTDAGKTATADASAGSASAEPAPPAAPRVIVLADDLIWQSRLVDHLRAAGAEPVRARGLDGLERALPSAGIAVVDLTARAYDGVAAIERATAAGARVLAVGQHDDHELRRRAREAGAERVLAYRKLFEDGPTTLATWLRSPIRVPG